MRYLIKTEKFGRYMPLYFSVTSSLNISLQMYIIKLHLKLIGFGNNAEAVIRRYPAKYLSYTFLKAIK